MIFNVIKKYEKCANRFLNYDKSTNELKLDSQFQTERQQTEFTLDELKEIEDKHDLIIIDSYRWELVEVVS